MMKKRLINAARIQSRLRFAVMMLLVISLGAGLGSCTNQKNLAKKKAAQELADKTAKAKTDLLAIINDDGTMTLEEKEFKLASIKRMNLDNQEIKDLIGQAEESLPKKDLPGKKERRRKTSAKTSGAGV